VAIEVDVVAGEAAVTEEDVVVAVVVNPLVDQPDKETGSAPIPTVATTTSPGVMSATGVRPAVPRVQEVVMMTVVSVVAGEAVVVTGVVEDSVADAVVVVDLVAVAEDSVADAVVIVAAAVDSVVAVEDQTDGEVTVEIVVIGHINLYLWYRSSCLWGTGRNRESCVT